jgi:hypothetical protein
VECWNRIENELPCYNQKGEAYYPPTDKAKREELLQKKKKTSVISNVSNDVINDVSDCDLNTPSTCETAPEESPRHTGQPIHGDTGSDFQMWV